MSTPGLPWREMINHNSPVRRGGTAATVVYLAADGWCVAVSPSKYKDFDIHDSVMALGLDLSVGTDPGGPAVAGWELDLEHRHGQVDAAEWAWQHGARGAMIRCWLGNDGYHSLKAAQRGAAVPVELLKVLQKVARHPRVPFGEYKWECLGREP